MHAYTAGETRKRETQEWQLDPRSKDDTPRGINFSNFSVYSVDQGIMVELLCTV